MVFTYTSQKHMKSNIIYIYVTLIQRNDQFTYIQVCARVRMQEEGEE